MTPLGSKIADLYVRGMQFFNFNWLSRVGVDATAEILCKLLPVCPGCDLPTSKFHAYGKLSCVISEGRADTVGRTITQMNDCAWADLARENEFDPMLKALVVYVVICAQSCGGAAVAILNPSDLYESHSLLHVRRLSMEELAGVRPLLSFERPLSGV
jgi:hypothetical protein